MQEENVQVAPEQGGFLQGAEAGEHMSRIQKLKQQKARLLEENQALQESVSGMQAEMRELKEAVQGLRDRNGKSSRWEDLSERELMSMATDGEVAKESPQVSINAAIQYLTKLVDSKFKGFEERISQNVFGAIEQRRSHSDVIERIRKDFGEEALDRDSDLYQLAEQKYKDEQRRYGQAAVVSNPLNKYRIIREAKEEIARSKPGGNEPFTRKPTGPPVEDRVEGGGQTAVDRIALRDQALKKGDWREALNQTVDQLLEE